MRQALLFELRPRTPFIVSLDRERNIAPALDHVPGSALRGALASAYLRRNGKDATFRRLFQTNRARFPFCYPGSGAPRPAPLSAYSCKGEGGPRQLGGHGVVDLWPAAVGDRDEDDRRRCGDPSCDAPLVRYRQHVARDGGSRPLQVVKSVRMRVGIRRETGSARSGLLFGHEAVLTEARAHKGAALEPLVLSGIGCLDDADAAVIDEVARKETLRIGRSRAAGFGEFALTVSPVPGDSCRARLERFASAAAAHVPGGHTPFLLTALTPAVLVDGLLRYTGDLAAEVDEELAIAQVYARVVLSVPVMGWNLAGDLPKSTDRAVASGSFLLAGSKLGPDELAARLDRLQQTGIGLRRSEGYGEVLACDPFAIDNGEQHMSPQQRADRTAPDVAESLDRTIEKAIAARAAQIERIAALAQQSFGDRGRTQLSALEQLGVTAASFTELIAWVKRQAGKGTRDMWLKPHGGQQLGPVLVDLLTALEKEAIGWVGSRDAALDANLPERYAGRLLRHLNSEYLYQRALQEPES